MTFRRKHGRNCWKLSLAAALDMARSQAAGQLNLFVRRRPVEEPVT